MKTANRRGQRSTHRGGRRYRCVLRKHGTQNPRAPLLPFALRTKRRDEHLRHHPPIGILNSRPDAPVHWQLSADTQMGGDRVGNGEESNANPIRKYHSSKSLYYEKVV